MKYINIEEVSLHQLTEAFPVMNPRDFSALVKDIKKNGIQDPVWVIEGNKIIDGRHRYLAAQELGLTKLPIRYYEGKSEDMLNFILSTNLHRRHLKTSQRAVVAAQLVTTTHGGDRKSQDARVHFDITLDSASKMLNISRRTVANAKRILESSNEELKNQLLLGQISINKALELLDNNEFILPPKKIDTILKQTLSDALLDISDNKLQIKAVINYIQTKGWSLEYLLKVITEYDEETIRIGTTFKKAFDDNIYGIDGLATLVRDNLDVIIKEIKRGFF